MDKLLDLDIVSPTAKVYSGKIKTIIAPGSLGGFQVMFNHAPLVSTLNVGKLKIVDENEKEKLYAISGGILEVNNNKVSVLAENIETPEELNIERIKAAIARYEDILHRKEEGTDPEEIRLLLKIEYNRLSLLNKLGLN
ncbi:MAG TPA: ATP synthase F1 subunit epsilon [Bacteroidetes bacterium]|nr:ATP synthase F1 subunit epsilon [Bacteroidota bacterium]HCN37620.1 ATP synthase F1 subunit epsilon [Bacteroidota bacterium]